MRVVSSFFFERNNILDGPLVFGGIICEGLLSERCGCYLFDRKDGPGVNGAKLLSCLNRGLGIFYCKRYINHGLCVIPLTCLLDACA